MVHSVLLGLTCLFHGLRAADGQVAADRQWRIVNAEPLAGFWSVVEVEFHSSSSCNEIVGGAPIASGSVLISLSGAHDVSLAVDGISTPVVSAGWWSDCGYVLGDPTNFGGGCAVGEAWIGMDSGFTTFETKCVRLMQPADSNHSASTIGLDRWDGSSWVRIKTFVNTGGVEAEGRFLDLTVDPDSKWRVKPLLAEANWDPWPTSSEWAVAELQLFDNVECREPALSARFSGSGFVGDGVTASDATYSPSLAQDGDLATAWAAPCPSGVACGSEGAWLEAQLQVPSVVRCLRLFQATTAASAVVSLESGSGTVYTNVSRFSQLSGGAWEHLARWEVANKALGSMWRLVPTGVGPQAWRVIEIELFAAENCSLPLAFDSFASGGLGMALAGDGDLTTAWQAASLADSGAWLGRYEGTETLHRLGWPWLGLSTADGVVPLCLRLLQGNESSRFANDVVLQRWSGSSWLDYQVSLSGIGTIAPHFLELGTGLSYLPETWARLPFLDRLQWRVQALDVMLNSWALKELQFYEAIDCQQEVEGLPIAAGQDPMEPSRNASLAFDQNQLTDWWSVCTRCLKGAAWIGQAVARARNIRCFRLFQSSLPAHGNAEAPWFTGLVSLDKWNGNRWATLETFSGLSRGVWEQKLIYSHSPLAQDSASVLPYWVTEAERLWRVTTLDNLPRRWYVGSVSFFWDLACSTPILDANIIASGWALGFEAENAFGQNVSIRSEWASACDGCGSQQAWLGLALPLPSWPRCVQIFQTPRTGFGSRLLSVERFDGSAWVSVAQKASTPTAWETIELPGPGQAYSVPYPVRVAPDGVSFAGRIAWRLVAKGPNRRGWQVSGLRIFSDLSCRDEVSGIVTASGFADGHEPELAVGSNDTSTFWEASCTQCTDQGTLGVSLTTETILPRCFQLYQPDDSWAASSISIQVLEETDEGETWLEVKSFENLNVQVWDNLHILGPVLPQVHAVLDPLNVSTGTSPPPGVLWRVVNGAPIEWNWAVSRLRFFLADESVLSGCSSAPLTGTTFASGKASASTAPENALNSLDGEMWRSSCFGCSSGAAWIGVIFDTPQEVACVEILQSGDELSSTPTIHLERWAGLEFATMETFTRVGGGELALLNHAWAAPEAHMRARALSLHSPINGWSVSTLQFFADVECTMEVRGFAISSGFSGQFVPSLAFDGNLSTFWKAQSAQFLPPGEDATQWLGLQFTSPTDVKCAMLRQVDLPGQYSPSVAFEIWLGSEWSRKAELQTLSTGAWFAIHWFGSGWDATRVNFQTATSTAPDGYLVDTGRLYPGLFQLTGYRYGWSCPFVGGYNRRYYDDPVLDTGMALACEDSRWELDVVVGRFYVRVQYSDPGQGGETEGCRLEDVPADTGTYELYATPDIELTVPVVDARLTFNGSAQSGCTSVSALEIYSLPRPNRMWRLRALSGPPERWTVQELSLHEDNDCLDTDVSETIQHDLFSSGYQEGHPPSLAFDGSLETSWRDSCLACEGGVSWVALSLTESVRIRCVRLFQDASHSRLASAVVLESWNATAWVVESTFADLQGGAWAKYNSRWESPAAQNRWRFVLASPNMSLAVAELAFFSDLACSQPIAGIPIASATRIGAAAYDAFDGNDATSWISECRECAIGEAWIGLHLDVASDVACTSLLLASPPARRLQGLGGLAPGIPALGEPIQLELEAWNSTSWVSADSSVALRIGARGASPRLAAEGLEPSRAWRIVTATGTTVPWRVQEVEFHTQSSCDALAAGHPIASSQLPTRPAENAFDGNSATDSAWVAGCPQEGCPPGQWIGLLLEAATSFQCIRIYQASGSLLGNPFAEVLRIERWAGSTDGWEPSRTFGTVNPLSGGQWSDLIVLPAEAKFAMQSLEWRVVSESSVTRHWAVAELAFFDNVECQFPAAGTASASGEAANRFASAAFDGQVDTFWWSQEAPGAGEAWLGRAFSTPLIVRCVQIVLDSTEGFRPTSLQLQSRPEVDWLHIKSFDNLLFGVRQNHPVFEAATDKPAGAMWRVLNAGPIDGEWTLVELEFYSDAECTRLEVGRAISPGYVAGHEPALAFDLGLRSWSRSPCSPCARGQAWLGLSFYAESTPKAVDVKCVVLMQGSGPTNSSQNVTVERWDGNSFAVVRRFDFILGGEFVRLRLDLIPGAAGAVVVDYERKVKLQEVLEETEDPADKRDALHATYERVEADLTMTVATWPPELLSSTVVTQNFIDAWSDALRAALVLQLSQPLGNIFVDGAQLRESQPGLTEPAVSARIVVYVAQESDVPPPGRTWELDSRVVYDYVRRVSQDPFNVDSLFLLDQFKSELRKATSLNPLQASIVAQIEPSLVLQMGVPERITLDDATTTSVFTIPTDDSAFQEQSNLATILVVSAVSLCFCSVLCRFILFRRQKMREESEAAAAAGVRPRSRRWFSCPTCCRKYLCCCFGARQRESSPFQSNREQLQFQQSRRSASTLGKPAAKSSSNLAAPRRV